MKLAITAESTIDLPKRMLQEFDIHTVPFTVIMGEKSYLDGEVGSDALYAYVKQTKKLPHTAAVNQFQYEELFKKMLESYDYVLHFSLSSAISSAYQNASAAAEEFGGKVKVIDSLTLSSAIALQAIYARELANAGYSLDEIEAKVLARRSHAKASFTIETLDYLYKGGRCNALSMLGANLLHLKPQIIVQEDGSMTKDHIYRGPLMKVNRSYVKDQLEAHPNPDLSFAFITTPVLPQEVADMMRQMLVERGFQRIEQTTASATISVYCGPNTVGILFYDDGPHPIEPKQN